MPTNQTKLQVQQRDNKGKINMFGKKDNPVQILHSHTEETEEDGTGVSGYSSIEKTLLGVDVTI